MPREQNQLVLELGNLNSIAKLGRLVIPSQLKCRIMLFLDNSANDFLKDMCERGFWFDSSQRIGLQFDEDSVHPDCRQENQQSMPWRLWADCLIRVISFLSE